MLEHATPKEATRKTTPEEAIKEIDSHYRTVLSKSDGPQASHPEENYITFMRRLITSPEPQYYEYEDGTSTEFNSKPKTRLPIPELRQHLTAQITKFFAFRQTERQHVFPEGYVARMTELLVISELTDENLQVYSDLAFGKEQVIAREGRMVATVAAASAAPVSMAERYDPFTTALHAKNVDKIRELLATNKWLGSALNVTLRLKAAKEGTPEHQIYQLCEAHVAEFHAANKVGKPKTTCQDCCR